MANALIIGRSGSNVGSEQVGEAPQGAVQLLPGWQPQAVFNPRPDKSVVASGMTPPNRT